MEYRVEIALRALVEIDEVFAYIAADSPERATAFYRGLLSAVGSLATFPDRCGLAPENDATDFEVRQRLYGSYRILFTIGDGVVNVLRVRHAARRSLTARDLGQS